MDIQKTKIVADSSADLVAFSKLPFSMAPLKIITSEKEYVDDENLDVNQMVFDLSKYSGKSKTACPAPADWMNAFGDEENVFCVSITGSLSGSYNAACVAKRDYEEKFPSRRAFVINSLSAGPELGLIVEKIADLVNTGKSFEDVCTEIMEYKEHTGLVFMLESLKNLANNGRVSPLVAKAAGLLGIRLVGKASDEGTLEPLEKCRGEQRALSSIVATMKKLGATDGKVKIGHCQNENAANKLKELILSEFKGADVEIYQSRGLCSFYAEKGGLMIGFEKQGVK